MYKIIVDKSAYSQYLSRSVTQLVKICYRNPVYCMACLGSTFMFSVPGTEHRAYCLLGVDSTTRLCVLAACFACPHQVGGEVIRTVCVD